jgi:DNA polymerase-3 subunit epsilon
MIHLPVTTLPAGAEVAARPPERPDSLAQRARRAAGAGPAPAPGLHFAVRGSSGNRYAVTMEDRSNGPNLRCTCMAGRYGTLCRHVKSLLAGDITDLLSNNHDDVEVLRVRMTAGSLG